MKSRLVISLVGALLTSCFTGVETTPKITSRDVQRENASVQTPEDLYLAEIRPEPFEGWVPGKRVYVTDEKIGVIFGASMPDSLSLAGREIRYAGSRATHAFDGTPLTEELFLSPRGDTLVYRASLPGLPPFTIDVDEIERARKLMKGQEYYVTTSIWRDSLDAPIKGDKFVCVRVDDVVPGTADYPLRVTFTEVADGARGSLLVNPDPKARGSRTFPQQFSLTDPRLRYPHVSDPVWEHIQRGEVALGMTRDECRLALGPPKDLDRGAGNSYVHEIWSYESGVYLIFTDGVLTDYRR